MKNRGQVQFYFLILGIVIFVTLYAFWGALFPTIQGAATDNVSNLPVETFDWEQIAVLILLLISTFGIILAIAKPSLEGTA